MALDYFGLLMTESAHLVGGIAIASVAFVLVLVLTRKPYDYAVFFLLPSLFAAIFPDLMYTSAYFIDNGFSLEGLLARGSYNLVYRIFHQGLPSILVVPITLLGVVAITRVLNHYLKRKVEYPPKWIVIVGLLSLINVWMHIVIDKLGF